MQIPIGAAVRWAVHLSCPFLPKEALELQAEVSKHVMFIYLCIGPIKIAMKHSIVARKKHIHAMHMQLQYIEKKA